MPDDEEAAITIRPNHVIDHPASIEEVEDRSISKDLKDVFLFNMMRAEDERRLRRLDCDAVDSDVSRLHACSVLERNTKCNTKNREKVACGGPSARTLSSNRHH